MVLSSCQPGLLKYSVKSYTVPCEEKVILLEVFLLSWCLAITLIFISSISVYLIWAFLAWIDLTSELENDKILPDEKILNSS